MDVRPATPADGPSIRELVEHSLNTSYSLSPVEIETLLERFFSEAALTDRIDDSGELLYVAEGRIEAEDDSVAILGVAQADPEGTLQWLHVDPEARGQGAGTALMDRVRAEMADRETPLTARVLETASEGSGFLERFGLTETGTATFDPDGLELAEHVYTMTGTEQAPNEPSVEVPATVESEDLTLLVDRDDDIPGSEAPFFTLYESENEDSRWGFFCSECASTDVSADGLDRLECGNCGNTHLADQWDAAYL